MMRQAQVVWYTRRPAVGAFARAKGKQETRKTVKALRAAADVAWRRTRNLNVAGWFLSHAQELELHVQGAQVVELAPGEPCPDPRRCFEDWWPPRGPEDTDPGADGQGGGVGPVQRNACNVATLQRLEEVKRGEEEPGSGIRRRILRGPRPASDTRRLLPSRRGATRTAVPRSQDALLAA